MLCSSPYRLGVQEFGCGQCMPCRFNRRRVWTARLLLEARLKEPNYFVGLTYRDEDLPADGLVSKRALQLFFKRLRRRASCRYFAVGEYGGKFGRPHYHALVFGLSEAVPSSGGFGIRHRKACDCALCASWGFGHVHVGEVTPESCSYVAGYVEKGKLKELPRPEFTLMSRRPGIGVDAVPVIFDAWREGDAPGALKFGGKIQPLGRLLRKKLEGQAGVVGVPDRVCLSQAANHIQEAYAIAADRVRAARRELVRQKHAHSARVRSQIGRSKREAR